MATPKTQNVPAVNTGAVPVYDGGQIHPGTVVDPTAKAGPPAGDPDQVAADNPRDATGQPADMARDIEPEGAARTVGGRPVAGQVAAVRQPSLARGAVVGTVAGAAVVATPLSYQDEAKRLKEQEAFRREGVDLLFEACDVLGINPDSDLPTFDARKNQPTERRAFKQLLSWQFYPGDQSADGYNAVVLVTAGGLKARYSENPAARFDDDTLTRLRQAFGAFKVDPSTKQLVAQPLPASLQLPLPAILGFPIRSDHVYQRGYLTEGGKREADRRQALADRSRERELVQ